MYLQHGIPSPSHKDSALVSVRSLPLHGQEAKAAHAAEVLLKSCTEPRNRREGGHECMRERRKLGGGRKEEVYTLRRCERSFSIGIAR